MPLSRISFQIRCLITLLILGVTLPAGTVAAQDPELVVTVDSVVADPGEQGVIIPIYLENYADSIAGFELWLILDRPDIFEFETYAEVGADTTFWTSAGQNQSEAVEVSRLTAKMGSQEYDRVTVKTGEITKVRIDTAGTLVSGWQIIQARSLGGAGYDALIVCIANDIPEPFNPGFGYPNYGDVPLIKIYADVYDILYAQEPRTARIMVNDDSFEHFGFSDPQGQLIGLKYDTLVDTIACYNCVLWDGDICVFWEPAPGTTGDSCVYDSTVMAVLDTTIVEVNDGALTIAEVFICGDANCDGNMNILDITYLVDYLYREGPPPLPNEAGDADGSGETNILDITNLINYLYKEGPAPICE
ncbi:MAG: dockerin type I repeat-containing protein [Candidatus Zixiibacteriota bacterium]|nr:MAG: dockerin type I repeat-containing protein [candidate division Zixibacteria bacterium]